jgi:hypothetical protein
MRIGRRAKRLLLEAGISWAAIAYVLVALSVNTRLGGTMLLVGFGGGTLAFGYWVGNRWTGWGFRAEPAHVLNGQSVTRQTANGFPADASAGLAPPDGFLEQGLSELNGSVQVGSVKASHWPCKCRLYAL